MRAPHIPDAHSSEGAVLAASADELDELLGFIAANANHETNRRRQKRLDASFDALTEALRAVESPDALQRWQRWRIRQRKPIETTPT